MKKHDKKGSDVKSQDGKLVSTEPYELKYEANKLGLTEEAVLKLKEEAGVSRKAIEKKSKK